MKKIQNLWVTLLCALVLSGCLGKFETKLAVQNAPNNAPMISIPMGIAFTVAQLELLTDRDLNAFVSELDGQGLVFTMVTPPSHGALTITEAGLFSYDPSDAFEGEDSFAFRVSDGIAEAVGTIRIRVTVTNLPPEATDSPTNPLAFSVVQNKVLANQSLANYASDPENAPLIFEKISNPSHGTVTLSSSGNFTYNPEDTYVGTDSFEFRVSDGEHTSNTAAITIQVTAANQPPVAQDTPVGPPIFSVEQGQTLANQSLTAYASDPENGSLTFEKVSDPSHGSVSLTSTGQFTYVADEDFAGNDTFTFKVFDGELSSQTARVTIKVTAVELPPIDVTLSPTNSVNSYYGDTIPVRVAIALPSSITTGNIRFTGSATLVGNNDPGTTPVAVISYGDTVTTGALEGDVPLTNGKTNLDFTVMGYNGHGDVQLSVNAVFEVAGSTHQQSKTITIKPRAGFVKNGVEYFQADEIVDTSSNKGWVATATMPSTLSVQSMGMGMGSGTSGPGDLEVAITNRAADSGAVLTIAKLQNGYTAVSSKPIQGTSMHEPHYVVGARAVNVNSTTANQILGYSASDYAPLTINSAGAGTFVMAGHITRVNISAPGFYTVCPSALPVDLFFAANFAAGEILSIRADRPSISLTMENPNLAVPVNHLFLGGANGLNLSGSLRTAGNLTIGTSPLHPNIVCP